MLNFRSMKQRPRRKLSYRREKKVFLSNVVGRLRRSGRYSRHYLKDLEKGLAKSGYYEHALGRGLVDMQGNPI